MCRYYIDKMRLAVLVGACMVAAGLSAQHTMHVDYITTPTGPNSTFSVNLSMSPSDVDIVAFDIAVGYDSSLGSFINAMDNTGQPQADIEYTLGAILPLSGVSYADTYRPFFATTLADLIEPVNLAEMVFQTSSTFDPEEDQFYIYINGRNRQGPSSTAGGLVANIDGNWVEIPTEYDSLDPQSSVDDWMVY